MFDINDNLYYEKIKWYNKHILLNSIATVLNIDKKTIDLYNSNYTLFTNKIKKNIIFNTYYKLEKLISPNIGLINNKEVPIYIKKISFLKDDYELIDLFNNPKYKNTQYFFDKIHNINAPANVEIFINYLTSRIVELNLCPSFNLLYHVSKIIDPNFEYSLVLEEINNKKIYKKINYLVNENMAQIIIDKNDYIEALEEIEIEDNKNMGDAEGVEDVEDVKDIKDVEAVEDVEDLEDLEDLEAIEAIEDLEDLEENESNNIEINELGSDVESESSVSSDNCSDEDDSSYDSDDLVDLDIKFKIYNHPCILLITEKNEYKLSDFFKMFKNSDHLLKYLNSLSFQIMSAIIIMYRLFKIKNNDLHVNNILLKPTNIEFLYYKYNNICYKIPTYGYIAKIIDWGRGTYEYNNIKGYNNIFSANSFEGLYNYNKITIKEKCLPENFIYSDVSLFAHNILNELYINKIKNEAHNEYINFLNRFLETKDGSNINIENFDWDTYTGILLNVKPFTDDYIITDYFKEFITNENKSNDDIYFIL